jgi:XTP/dITP diphosphohydrolase
MEGIENRKAYFITVLCYYDENGAKYFDGRVHGNLLKENKGFKGFGYDPIFVPEGYEMTLLKWNRRIKIKSATENRLWIYFWIS